jgi:hypothetical protein
MLLVYACVFEAGMVLTCEPNIYILEEGIDFRLKVGFLITKDVMSA